MLQVPEKTQHTGLSLPFRPTESVSFASVNRGIETSTTGSGIRMIGTKDAQIVIFKSTGHVRQARLDPGTGYDFWLTKLNQFNGDFVNAESVKAFILSSEYRQRFGP